MIICGYGWLRWLQETPRRKWSCFVTNKQRDTSQRHIMICKYSTTFFHLCRRQTVGAAATDGTQFCLCGCKPHSWNGIMIMMMITMMMITMMMIDSMLCLWCSIHLVGLGSCLPTPHQPQSIIQSRPIAIISEIFSPARIFWKYIHLLRPRFDDTNM